MEKTLVDASVVVVASGFNVPLFSQLWLKDKKIFNEGELKASSSFFTPSFVQIETENSVLAIQANRLQLKIKNEKKSEITRVQKIILSLPECPYTGLGFNFSWSLTSFSEKITAVSKKNFLPSSRQNPWGMEFKKDPSVKVGAIYSKIFQESIMNLEIRPQTISVEVGDEQANKESMLFSFNFHHKVSRTSSKKEYDNIFKSWEVKYKESDRISSLLLG